MHMSMKSTVLLQSKTEWHSVIFKQHYNYFIYLALTLWHSEWSKLHRVLGVLSAIGLRQGCPSP